MPTRASGGLTQVRMGSSPCCETRNSLVKCGWSVRPHSATISFSAQSVDGTRPFDHSNQRRTVASPVEHVDYPLQQVWTVLRAPACGRGHGPCCIFDRSRSTTSPATCADLVSLRGTSFIAVRVSQRRANEYETAGK